MAQPTDESWQADLERLVPDLYRAVSRRVGGERALAEDIVQEAWLRALTAWRRTGPPRDASAWLRTTANNLLRNHFRRRAPEQRSGAAPDGGLAVEHLAADARDGAELAERAALVQWGLARLRRSTAELLAARHFDDSPLAELAARYGASERAIEGRLHRARGKLAALLAPYGLAPLRVESTPVHSSNDACHKTTP